LEQRDLRKVNIPFLFLDYGSDLTRSRLKELCRELFIHAAPRFAPSSIKAFQVFAPKRSVMPFPLRVLNPSRNTLLVSDVVLGGIIYVVYVVAVLKRD